MTIAKNAHCSWCGAPFAPDAAWPRTCAVCAHVSYRNPLPVAVALVPVASRGLLLVRRAIEPGSGELAMPGGFIEVGETWQQACVRELREETDLELPAAQVREFCVLSAPDGTLLVFGLLAPIDPDALASFAPNDEVSELVVSTSPDRSLAFPLHQEATARFFESWERMR